MNDIEFASYKVFTSFSALHSINHRCSFKTGLQFANMKHITLLLSIGILLFLLVGFIGATKNAKNATEKIEKSYEEKSYEEMTPAEVSGHILKC
jgi:hypothetical protein